MKCSPNLVNKVVHSIDVVAGVGVLNGILVVLPLVVLLSAHAHIVVQHVLERRHSHTRLHVGNFH